MPFVVGGMVGQYRILAQLGQGGMATVFKAYHASLDRYVAIKALHPAFMEDSTFLARFQREARVVAKLDHPNIVPIYDYSDHEGQPYLVMKFVEGQTLKARLNQGPLDRQEILRIVEAVGAGLSYAHRSGILHRDIKPSNVLLATDGQIYLADFGLARIAAAGESTISSDMMVGTPQYISPEQAKGSRNLDEGTDIYSFGVLLYELVVGRVPFTSDTPYSIIHDHIYSPLPLPRQVRPDVSEGVERVLLKALAKERSDRYATVQDMVQAFKAAFLAAPEASASPVATSEVPPALETRISPVTVPKTEESPRPQAETTKKLPAAQPPASAMPAPGPQPAAPAISPKTAHNRLWRILVPLGLLILCLCGLFGLVIRQGNLGNPVQQAQAEVKRNPQDPWAHYHLAVALADDGRLNEAQQEYVQALSLGGQQVEFYQAAGDEMKARGYWTAAAMAYLRLVDVTPKPLPIELIFQLHEALYRGASEERFLEFIPLEEILRVEPGMAAVVEARHMLYFGEPVRAQVLVEVLLRRSPDHLEGRLLQAEIHWHAGNPQAAREQIERLRNAADLPHWINDFSQMILDEMQP